MFSPEKESRMAAMVIGRSEVLELARDNNRTRLTESRFAGLRVCLTNGKPEGNERCSKEMGCERR